MKKMFRTAALVLGISLLACACEKTPTNDGEPLDTQINGTEPHAAEKQNKLDLLRPIAYNNVMGLNLEPGSCISIIGRYAGDSYWEELEAGAEKAIDDINDMLGYKGDDKIKLSYNAPGIRDDMDEQVSILDEELARYPIAICIAPVDTSACLTQFELAEQDAISIITFDSGSEYQEVGAHISTNNNKASSHVAQKLAALMEESGQVALIVQDSLSMTAKVREHAFLNEIAKYPNISVPLIYHLDELEVLAEQMLTDVKQKDRAKEEKISQEDVILYLLEQHPDLKAIYTTNLDTTQLVADVLKEAEREDLIFVGYDGGKEQMELLEDDVVKGLILQNPYGMGYATVVAAARTALNLPNEAFIDSGFTWITKDNMEDPAIQKFIY